MYFMFRLRVRDMFNNKYRNFFCCMCLCRSLSLCLPLHNNAHGIQFHFQLNEQHQQHFRLWFGRGLVNEQSVHRKTVNLGRVKCLKHNLIVRSKVGPFFSSSSFSFLLCVRVWFLLYCTGKMCVGSDVLHCIDMIEYGAAAGEGFLKPNGVYELKRLRAILWDDFVVCFVY